MRACTSRGNESPTVRSLTFHSMSTSTKNPIPEILYIYKRVLGLLLG